MFDIRESDPIRIFAPSHTEAVRELLARLDAATSEHPVVLGRYTVTGRIGAGGLGVVYHATSNEHGQQVALKTLPRLDPGALLRLKQEFRMVGDISHRNLVTLHEFVSDGDAWYFTMEYIDGLNFVRYFRGDEAPSVERNGAGRTTDLDCITKTADPWAQAKVEQAASASAVLDTLTGLDNTAAELRPLAPRDLQAVRDALRQLVAGVRALHRRGLLHLDIKPANVLVTPERRVVVLDFGLVANAGPQSINDDTSTSYTCVGTPAYMAPEQAAGEPVSEASDWYAVGVTLFRTLTGRLPFEGTLRQVLARKMVAEPMAPQELVEGVPDDLNEICIRMMRLDPADRVTGAELETLFGADVDPEPDTPSGIFVGRQAPLGTLRTAAEKVAEGHTITVHLSGCSGMGKSRLIRQFLHEQRAAHRDCVVLAGRCYERESVPYKAFDSLVDALSAYLQTLDHSELTTLTPQYVHELMRIFPVLMGINTFTSSSQDVVETGDLQEVRLRAFRGLRDLMARLGQRRRLIIHIDDVQWSDLDSARLLGELLSPPDPPMLLLLLSYRSDAIETSGVLNELRRHQPVRAKLGTQDFYEIRLDPLPLVESTRIAQSILGADQRTHDLAEAVAREADGNPLMVEEFARVALLSSKVPSDESVESKSTLRALVNARIGRLSPDRRRLVEIVAVSGRPLQQQIALQAAGGVDGDVYAAFGELRQAHLIRSAGARGTDQVDTYHDSIREAVIQTLDAARLTDLHAKLVAEFGRLPGVDPEIMARHTLGAGDTRVASEYLLEAAQATIGKLAFDRAAQLLADYADILEKLGETPSLDVRRQHAECLMHAGHCVEAATMYRLLINAATSRNERLRFMQLAVSNYLKAFVYKDAMEVLVPLFKELSLPFPRSSGGATMAAIWNIIILKSRGTKFTPRSHEQTNFEDSMRLDVLESTGMSLAAIDPISGAVCMLRSLRLALKRGDQAHVARGLTHFGLLLAWNGKPKNYATGLDVISQAREIADQLGDPQIQAHTMLGDGVSRAAVGRWHESIEQLSGCIDLCRRATTSAFYEWKIAKETLVYVRIWHGNLIQAMEDLEEFGRRCQAVGDRAALVMTPAYTGLGHLMANRHAQADSCAKQALSGLETGFHFQHVVGLLSQVWCALYAGRPEEAAWCLQRYWPDLVKSKMLGLQIVRFVVLRLRAQTNIARAACGGSETDRLLRQAAKDAKRLATDNTPPLLAMAALTDAGVARVRGDSEAAALGYQTAADCFTAAEMPLLSACARRWEGQLTGGTSGTALIAEADAALRAEGIVRPDRFQQMWG